MSLYEFAAQEAARQGVDQSLVLKVLQAESGGDAKAVSAKGARGPMQLMPATANDLGVNIDDPRDNIRGGIKYLKQQIQAFGSHDLALAAYNAGPGKVQKYGDIPPIAETQKYVRNIMGSNANKLNAADDSDIFGISSGPKAVVNDDSDIFGTADKKPSNQVNAKPAANQVALPKAIPLSRTERVTQGMVDPINGGAQFLTQLLPQSVVKSGNDLNNWLADKTGLVAKLPEGGVDQQVREQESEYQKRRSASGESGFDGYRVIGNVVSPANLAISSRLPMAASLTGKAFTGLLGGGISSLFDPVTQGNFWEEKGKQVGTGAVFGGATPVVASGLSRVISPKASVNPELALLRNEGVQPTIGQTLGGWANKLEEKATSIPFLGDSIASARNKAQQQFNNAAINRATTQIGKNVEGAGTDAVDQAHRLIGDAYDAAKSQLGAFRIDPQANSELSNLRMLAGSGLEGRERRTFNSYFTDYISGNKGFTADKFKELDSKLTGDIAKFGQGDAYQQKLGEALKEVQSILMGNARRANPTAAAALDSADKAYANLVRVEGASVAAKSADGVFTPGQLMTAVRAADNSARDNATARGRALMQDLAGAGTSVLGNKVADSGTAGRLMTAGAGAALWANPALTATGIGSGLLMYSPAGQALLRGAVADRPEAAKAVSKALQKASPRLVPAGAQIGLGLLN